MLVTVLLLGKLAAMLDLLGLETHTLRLGLVGVRLWMRLRVGLGMVGEGLGVRVGVLVRGRLGALAVWLGRSVRVRLLL